MRQNCGEKKNYNFQIYNRKLNCFKPHHETVITNSNIQYKRRTLIQNIRVLTNIVVINIS